MLRKHNHILIVIIDPFCNFGAIDRNIIETTNIIVMSQPIIADQPKRRKLRLEGTSSTSLVYSLS